MNKNIKILISVIVTLVIVAAVVTAIVLNSHSTEAAPDNEKDEETNVDENVEKDNEDKPEQNEEEKEEEKEEETVDGLNKEELRAELEAIESGEKRIVVKKQKDKRIQELKILLGDEPNTLTLIQESELLEEFRDIIKGRYKFNNEEEKQKRINEITVLLDRTYDQLKERVEEIESVDTNDPLGHLTMREKYDLIKNNLTDEDKAFAQDFQNKGYLPKLKEEIKKEVEKWNKYQYAFPRPEGMSSVSPKLDTLIVTEYKGDPMNHIHSPFDYGDVKFTYFVILNIEFSDGRTEELLVENIGRIKDGGTILTVLEYSNGQTDMEDWFFDTTGYTTLRPKNYILTDWIDIEN